MRITLAPGADENGLATMLAGLLEQNLEAHPERVRDFERLDLRLGIVARDIDVAVTLEFDRGHLVVRDGISGSVDARLTGTSDAVLDLPLLRTGPLGLPVVWDPPGRKALGRVFRGEMRISGLGALPRLTTLLGLLSVAERPPRGE